MGEKEISKLMKSNAKSELPSRDTLGINPLNNAPSLELVPVIDSTFPPNDNASRIERTINTETSGSIVSFRDTKSQETTNEYIWFKL